MYAQDNPKTKKQLREWVESGRVVRAFQPGGMFPGTRDGEDVIEGPHFPQPHKWYAQVKIVDGIIQKVLK